MRKFKKITAAMLAAMFAVQTFSAIPAVKAETTEEIKYAGVLGVDNVDGNSTVQNDAWLTSYIANSKIAGTTTAADTIYSYNATEIKKVLEIEDGTNIPACSFEFRIASGGAQAAVIENNVVKKLQVKAGIEPEKIKFKLENVNGSKFVTDSNTAYVPRKDLDDNTGLYKLEESDNPINNVGFVLEYQPQAISLPAEGSAAATGDNVLINNVPEAEGYSSTLNTYYAIKTVQMDFSEVGFTEPGIYRYLIVEADSPASTKDDVTDTSTIRGFRTLDVYVEDATYVKASDEKKQYDLRIAGYVMYYGAVIDAPDANPTISQSTEDKMEDGLARTNPSGNGGANGAEVSGAKKSEGYRNLYLSHDLTMKKTVSGNQASNDQFFKLTLTLSGDFSDDDIFAISPEDGDSTQVVIASWKTDNAVPNSATSYTKAEIYEANAATAYPATGTIEYRYVTGKQLKEGYSFYLQADQQVKLLGIPEGASYELREYNEDYKPTVKMEKSNGYDYLDGKSDESTAKEITDVVATADDAVCISDSYVEGDVSATFNNEKKGTIPTGIIMHVLPVAALAVVFGSGVIIFAARRRNDDEE